jgi:uncharacterized protein (TIGR03067 family)
MWMAGVLLVALCVSAGWAAEEPQKGDKAKLQGTWLGRNTGLPEHPRNQLIMTVKGAQSEFTAAAPGPEFKGTLVLNSAANPKQVDFAVKECSRPEYVGKSALAIYKLDEDGTLTIAANEPGNAARPEKFEGSEQTQVFAFKKWQPGMILPGNPPEMKVLEKRIGTWTTEVVTKPGPWNPTGRTMTGTETTEWVLGGRFQQTRNMNRPANPDGLFICTYDPQLKAYRAVNFDDQGFINDMTGQWDEAAQTMNWTSEKNGFRATGASRHVGPDNIEWQLVVKDPDGKVMLDISGKLTRKK